MPKKASPQANPTRIRDQFLQRATELWDTHEHEFMQVLDEAESKKINLTFKAVLDMSETAAKLQTGISFSQVVKDAREDVFDDPNQPALPGAEFENAAEQRKAAANAKAVGKKGGKGKNKTGDFQPPDAELENG